MKRRPHAEGLELRPASVSASAIEPAAVPSRDRTATRYESLPGGRGRAARGHGWTPTLVKPATYQLTSDQAPVAWPLIPGDGLPPWGAEMGFDALSGGTFYCDPMGWVADESIPVTNPNIFIFGKPGRGKSALVKTFLLRMARFGYRGLVLGDVKDEYEALSRALGVEPFRIGPGMTGRVNPLDAGPLGEGWEDLTSGEQHRRAALITSRWLTLLRGLVGSQGVPFGPTEERVLGQALGELVGWEYGATRLAPVTIPEVWNLLDQPPPSLVTGSRHASRQAFLDSTRLLRDALGALCSGSLRGMFDGPSRVRPDWRAPIQSLSLRALHDTGNQAAVGIALMCLNSWGQAMRELAGPDDHRVVLRDEAWLQTRLSLDAVMSLDANLRLSRRDGDVQIVTYHKPSDPLSAGDADSQATQIARDLLHLSDIRVLMGQDGEVADELGTLLGLNRMQRDVVTNWAMQEKGRALWLVGDRRFKVQTLLTPTEQRLTYTNDAVAGAYT